MDKDRTVSAPDSWQGASSAQQPQETLVRTWAREHQAWWSSVKGWLSKEGSSHSYLEDLADSLIQHLPVHLPAHLGPAQEKLLLLEVLEAKAEVCRVRALHPAPERHSLPLVQGHGSGTSQAHHTAHTYPLDDVLGWHAHHNPQRQLVLLDASADSVHGGHI